MCATGMSTVDEELTAILQSHQNSADTSLAGVVTSTGSELPCGLAFSEGQHLYSADSILGGRGRVYNDLAGKKPGMPIRAPNMPPQDLGGQGFAPCSPMLPKNGLRRQGWPAPAMNVNPPPKGGWVPGKNGAMELDERSCINDFTPAGLLDHNQGSVQDGLRCSGSGLLRYHSAPSSFLASLAELQEEVARQSNQSDSILSSYFSDDLPSLNTPNETSLEHMDTDQTSDGYKYVLKPRKFDRLVNSPSPYDQIVAGNGTPGKHPSLAPIFKQTLDVLPEGGVAGSSQMPQLMGMAPGAQTSQQLTTDALAMSKFAASMNNDFCRTGGSLGAVSSSRSSNLLRQSSSPAGLLAQLSIDVHNMPGTTEKQSLSSPLAGSPEDSLSAGTSEETGFGNAPGTPGMMSNGGGWDDAATSYMNSWNDSAAAARKRFRDIDMEPLSDLILPSDVPQRSSHEHSLPTLTRHMSLPAGKSNSAATMADDLLQSVPCRIRAKRGCATHPRSIAERVRRTRISERMRKLQDLVPNMDKQTNTADMLEEAADYVKHLQRQVQDLSDSLSKCKCKCAELDCSSASQKS